MNDILLDETTDEIEGLPEPSKSSHQFSDIIVTQIILCIAIVVGVFILNLVNPTMCKYMVDTFKHYTSTDFSKSIKDILLWLYDRV
jgi:hypothetical protein